MKKKKSLVILATIVLIASFCTFAVSAAQPRWTNANSITRNADPGTDSYRVVVAGVQGTTKIKITAKLHEKNIFGIFVEKHTTTGTYYSSVATLVGNYDMSTNKEYKITGTVEVTANGYTEVINLN